MKGSYDSDPAWSRAGNTAKKKKRNMMSRSSLRLLRSLIKKKRAADKWRAKTVCVTRTVELPSTHTIGEESKKLLFMLAIGLFPNSERTVQQAGPVVIVERLDPTVEAEAKARTKDVIIEICRRRKLESLQRRIECPFEPTLSSNTTNMLTNCAPEPETSSDEDVEVVDLVSSDDETYSTCDDDELETTSVINGTYRTSIHMSRQSPENSGVCKSSGNFRIITSSPHLRKPVFKPLLNNQDSGIFRNWKPESMSRLMNLKKNDAEKDGCISSLKGSQSQLLSSLKSIPAVRKLSSISSGATGKTHVHGALEDTSSSSGVSELDYIVPDDLITID